MPESLKKNIIYSLETLCTLEGLERNQLILFTAAGTIYGDVVVNDDDVADHVTSENLLQKIIEQSTKTYKEENGIDGPVSGNDGYVFLKNVTILNGNRTNIPCLVVFIDQIVAAAVGNID